MIDKNKIQTVVEREIADTDKFIVDILVNADNKIDVIVDSDASGVSIDDCVRLSRAVEDSLNRDEEDFELQVFSAGLDQPLKMLRQFNKYIGKELDFVFINGKKLTAKLVSASQTELGVEYEERVLVEGKKRRQLVTQNVTLARAEIKTAKAHISF